MSSTLHNDQTAASRDPPAEARLLASVARGDREAFQRLYFLFHRRLARFLLRVTRRPEIAEEIINDTMLVVWQRAAEFRGEAQASSWILGIAYRRALKTLSRKSESVPSIPAEALPALNAMALDGLAQRAELADWLDAAITRLTPEHQLVIQLAYVLGLSLEEIAEIADCPVNTVKTRMFHARRRLRELLVELAGPDYIDSQGAVT